MCIEFLLKKVPEWTKIGLILGEILEDLAKVNKVKKGMKISRKNQIKSKNFPIKPLKNALKMSQIIAIK